MAGGNILEKLNGCKVCLSGRAARRVRPPIHLGLEGGVALPERRYLNLGCGKLLVSGYLPAIRPFP